MKIYLPFIFLLLIWKVNVFAQFPPNQPQQDCIHAIPVCDSIVYESNSYRGVGTISAEIDSSISCLGRGERNGSWYLIHILQGGNLCFTITPDSAVQDIDWSVFNLTDATCEDIKLDPELEVSCNFITNAGPCNGITGADGATSGICGFQHLPCIPTQTGESYLLYVSNYNLANTGFTIDFSASTAVIFDDKAITAEAKVVMPSLNEIKVTFSKPMSCSQLQAMEFDLAGVSTVYSINTLSSDDCSVGSDYEPSVTLEVQPAIDLNELGNLELLVDDGLVEMCGKSTLTLTSLVGIEFDIESQPNSDSICSNESLNLSTNIPNNTNLQIRWFPGNVNSPTFQPTVGVSDTFSTRVFASNGIELGYERKNFTILPAPSVSIGEDSSLCAPDTLQLTAKGNYQSIIWNNNAEELQIQVNIGGIYWAEVRGDNGCRARDSVKITFVDLPNTGFSVNASGNEYTFIANCQDCSGYQWKLNNNNAGTGVNYTHVFTQPGQYLVELLVENPCGTGSSNQIINVVIASNEELLRSNISLYPNPTTDILQINSRHYSSSNVSIVNTVGKLVLSQEVGPNSMQKLNVSNLPKGLYLCKVASKEGSFTQKIWIKPSN